MTTNSSSPMRSGTVPDSFASAARFLGIAVLVLGMVVLAGWVFRVEALKSVLPGLMTMKFNTALGFTLAGAALGWREKRAASRALGGLVALLGALTLGEHFSARDFGIDQLFIRDAAPDVKAALFPGRMAPATAVCFFLCGTALVLLGARRPRWGAVVEMLAIAVGTAGAVALLGYAFGVEHLYTVPGFGSMALHTAAGFALLAAGLLCAVPQDIVALAVGVRGAARALWVGFGVLTVLLLVVGVISAARLNMISADVSATSEIARPRAAAARELEINVIGYGLEVRATLTGNAEASAESVADAQAVARHLADYERLARTPRQRELARRFAAQWRELHTYGEKLLAEGAATPAKLERLSSLRRALERFLDDEIQPDAAAEFEAASAATIGNLQTTEGLTLMLLIGGIVIALVTSGAVARAVLGGQVALCASEARLKIAAQAGRLGIWEWNLETNELIWDDAMFALYGVRREDFSGAYDAWAARLHPEDKAAAEALVREAIAGAKDFAQRFRVLWPDGTVHYLQAHSRTLRDPAGKPLRLIGTDVDITERMAADAALRESEERFRFALQAAELGAWEMNIENHTAWRSLRHDQIFGYAELLPEWTYEIFLGHVLEQDRAEVDRSFQHAVANRTDWAVECRIRRVDGEVRWISASGRSIARSGQMHMFGLVEDITDRKRADDDLRESQARYELVVTGTEAAIWDWDVAGKRVYFSPRWKEMRGLTDAEVSDREEEWSAGIHPEDKDRVLGAIRAHFEGRTPFFAEEYRIRHKDGHWIWVLDRGIARKDAAGQVVRMAGSETDISDRKDAEAALRESEARFRQVVESMAPLVWTCRADGPCDYLSPQWIRYTGKPEAEQLGYGWLEQLHPEDREATIARWQATAAEGKTFESEFRILRHDGEYRWFQTQAVPLRDEAGVIIKWFGSNTDVTERKEAEAALRTSDERLRLFIEHAPAAIAMFDREMLYLAASRHWREDYAIRGDYIGRLHYAVHPDLPERWKEMHRRGLAGEVMHSDGERFEHADGSEQWVKWDVLPWRTADGEIGGILIAAEDITASKQAEEKLRAAAEVEIASKHKSEFLANMSHELRTPLNPILVFSQQLAENKAGNLTARQVEFSRHIHSSGTDLLHLITDILDISKIESGTVTVDVEDIAFPGLRDTIERNFRHMAEAKNLPFHVHFAEGLPAKMNSDPKRLQQILKNLLSNAVKFTSHGHVDVRVDMAASGWSADHPVLSKAPQVVAFAVEDTGIGIAPEKQQLIFVAFQQADAGTSRKYGGTGLGLAISRELAELLGGELKLASVEGAGSTFTLYLPLHYAGAADAKLARPARIPAMDPAPAVHREALLQPGATEGSGEALRGCKVLVVDDDARNIFALTALLENHGADVLAATDGRSAIDLIQRTPDLGIVLMDIMMPGMDGYETMREIRQDPQFRTLPILALTAKAMKGDREKCLDAGASDYISKPVNTDQLLSLMRVWLFR